MKVLLVHNRYQQAGGEDRVFETERDALRSAGHIAETVEVSNAEIDGPLKALATAGSALYSPRGRALVGAAIARLRPDVVHVHNTFPLLSPSVFHACTAAGVPAVWTLHNFRLACANGLLFRQTTPCEDCLGHMPWQAVRHACYRGSRAGSAAVAAMIGVHGQMGTWKRHVARYIALTPFARDLFIRAGLPEERIVVKPNFLPDPAAALPPPENRSGFIFVGRLSPEKGISTLLEAWRGNTLPLTILGDGPLAGEVAAAAALNPAIRYLGGALPRPAVLAAMAGAEALILPSIWYENFPMVAVEAMALSTPVIASDIGGLPAIVEDGGLLFSPSDAAALRQAIAAFATREEDRKRQLGIRARDIYARRLSRDAGLTALLAVYGEAIAYQHASRRPFA